LKTVYLKCLFVLCALSLFFACAKAGDKIFIDSTAQSHLIFHHHFDAGAICRLGPEHVRTYNDYERSTSSADNYRIGKYSRFLTIRISHGIVFKKTFEAGLCYGADIYIQANDMRAFIPLMVQVLNNTRITKKVALMFVERDGYAFYVHSKNTNPFLKYEGVEGGFTSETLMGISLLNKRRNYLQILVGYKLQHIHTRTAFYPDQNLTQVGGVYANLPSKVTETTNGFYHFIYLSLGVPF
jgi:hypothetical protein